MNPYIANTPRDVEEMLAVIGVDTVDDLFKDLQPRHAPRSFDLPEGRSEQEVVAHMRHVAGKNRQPASVFIGGGFYDHYIPAAVPALIGRGEFFTAYTPYQPECAQGTLQALYEFQSAICALTGMPVSNASLYDGGTALYEAAMMALRVTGRERIVVDGGVSPIYRTMLRSYLKNVSIDLVELDPAVGTSDRSAIAASLNDQTAALIVQNPNFFGVVDGHRDLVEMAHRHGALVIQSVYPVALGMIQTPGEIGVDIATGEGQSLGLPLSFGGPYLGFMTTRVEYMRKMPGRIVGATVDAVGQRCFVNTLQAREQHIRREKATSNICTNVALCAIQAAVYMSLIGRSGLTTLARLNRDKAEYAKALWGAVPGVAVASGSATTFNEFVLRLPCLAAPVVEAMLGRGFVAGFPLSKYFIDKNREILVAVTEKRTRAEIEAYAAALTDILKDQKRCS